MKVEGGGHYSRAVNDGARTVSILEGKFSEINKRLGLDNCHGRDKCTNLNFNSNFLLKFFCKHSQRTDVSKLTPLKK